MPQSAPDRVFTRTLAMVFAAWIATAVLAAIAAGVVAREAGRAAELSRIATGQAAEIRRIEDQLRAGMQPELGELAALEARRVALEREAPGIPGLEAAFAAARDARVSGPVSADAQVARQAFAAGVGGQAERVAAFRDAAAARAAERARLAGGFALALHLLVAGGVFALVVLPARARVAGWVRASQEAEQENRHRLLHDPLTQLPNAAYLQAHLARLAAGAERSDRHVAVIRLGLDKFKALRETLGARTADDILRIAARRIRQSMRVGDFPAYLGQDEFVLVAGDLEGATTAAAIAHRLQTAIAKPFSLQGGARRIGCSIGVAMLGDDLPESERALSNAEIALTEAQAAGGRTIRYFRESLREEAERRERLFAELLAGLDREEFVPFFQPQVDLATGAFSGFEALARWRHPRHGLLGPASFLPYAEQSDLIERLGETVLSQTLAALTAWDAAGLEVPRVGVNFAMGQLRDPRLVEKIKWEVERCDVDPSRIAIEVLETVLIKSEEDLVVRNLRGLASAGFRVELDDFGTGHASIQNLRRFSVHRIKIDRSFVAGIDSSEEQRILTASMIAMARALGIETLAEGVESAAATATLRRLGCDGAQGWHIGRPMPQAETFAWLKAFRPQPPAPEAPVPAPAPAAPEPPPLSAAADPNMP